MTVYATAQERIRQGPFAVRRYYHDRATVWLYRYFLSRYVIDTNNPLIEFAQQVVDARAILSEEPSIGAIYDPPFSHFTLQLAEDYDWDRLAGTMGEFAEQEKPFEAKTMGLWVTGGETTGIAVQPYASEQMRDFQNRLWQAILPCAKGNVRKLDYPETWFPHVTIKRCGTDKQAFGRAMAIIMEKSYQWSFTVDNIAVQHDPGQNSRTHYLRLYYPLGGGKGGTITPAPTNATMVELAEEKDGQGAPIWIASVELDAGGSMRQSWTAPEMVRLMAETQCSDVHFAGGRCFVEGGSIAAVEPKTPFPITAVRNKMRLSLSCSATIGRPPSV